MANIYDWQEYVSMSRSKMKQKVPYKTSLPFGKIAPIGGVPFDVLPHSTVKLDLSNITRMLTPVSPIMDDISMDVYSFFCPWRILYSKTKNFFGENDQVAWTLVTNQKLPLIQFLGSNLDGIFTTVAADFASDAYLYLFGTDADGNYVLLKSVFEGSLFDYFGLPFVYPNYDVASKMQTAWTAHSDDVAIFPKIQAMPFRGVQAIYNEFFRNENVTDPILDLLYDNNDLTFDLSSLVALYKAKSNIGGFTYNFWFLPAVARYRDLFTTLNPAPQRGPAVSLPLAGSAAPLKVGDYYKVGGISSDIPAIKIGSSKVLTGSTGLSFLLGTSIEGTNDSPAVAKTRGNLELGDNNLGGPDYVIDKTNLMADLSSVTMATVNQIRYAFATQRYYEKLARGGARYHEYLRVMFGVRPADAVLQRPQYLGGHHQHINVQQVLQTSETSSTPLGSTGAYSVTGFKSHTFTNSFTEFGIILTFATTRKQHTYCQGLDKYWTKRDVFDIYNPTFAHIGEVPVMKNEVYWQPQNDDVLGYNEAWYEYREISPAKVTGLLNPLAPNNLSTFVLTDVYDSAPTLSDNFIFEDPNGLDRALVAGASSTNQFICDFLFEYTFSVVMPVHSTPGLIDHY